MKKKNIIVAILVIIAVTTFIVGAIIEQQKVNSEKHLSTVISSFLAHDSVWNAETQELYYPEYIEILYLDNAFSVIFSSEEYKINYSTKNKPELLVETSDSIKNSRQHSEFTDIFSICKRMQYDTCFLRTYSDNVLIKKIRIYRDGSLKAEDVFGTWHQKITCNNFILA